MKRFALLLALCAAWSILAYVQPRAAAVDCQYGCACGQCIKSVSNGRCYAYTIAQCARSESASIRGPVETTRCGNNLINYYNQGLGCEINCDTPMGAAWNWATGCGAPVGDPTTEGTCICTFGSPL
jgi:hypothetical protein